jgi:formamidopyrimidine-DNA glycosylase
MPELPDISAYVAALDRLISHQYIRSVSLCSPFVLRSVDVPLELSVGQPIRGVLRLGKQIILELPDELYLVFHLMIAGRLHWDVQSTRRAQKNELLRFAFDQGTLRFTEASTTKRASLHVVRGATALASFDRGGVEPLECRLEDFERALAAENAVIKRALTNPARFSGIGNAYSDEILVRAQLSPFLRTRQLSAEQRRRLFEATRETLRYWLDRSLAESRESFPKHVTAFRPGMLVHGRYKQPCGQCGTTVQRVVYREREFNYCPRCQTEGRILADRSLSRLLKDEWPKRIDDE